MAIHNFGARIPVSIQEQAKDLKASILECEKEIEAAKAKGDKPCSISVDRLDRFKLMQYDLSQKI